MASRTRKTPATNKRRRETALPPDVRQPADTETKPPTLPPAVTPNVECEQRLIAIIQQFLPVVHPLDIAKSLGALQVDCYAVYADNAARGAEERALHRALNSTGRGFRRMATPQNKATRKKKK